jgi:hypothetical protein
MLSISNGSVHFFSLFLNFTKWVNWIFKWVLWNLIFLIQFWLNARICDVCLDENFIVLVSFEFDLCTVYNLASFEKDFVFEFCKCFNFSVWMNLKLIFI